MAEVIIGIDPHKGSHTAVALDRDEHTLAKVRVKATAAQVEQLRMRRSPGRSGPGHTAAAPLLRRAVQEFSHGDLAANGGFRWLWLAEAAAIELWDHYAWYALAAQEVHLVREAGALSVLPLSLNAAIVARIFAGELDAAESLIEEVRLVTDATGQPPRSVRAAHRRGLAGPDDRARASGRAHIARSSRAW